MDKKLNLVELVVLAITSLIVAIGLISSHVDLAWFEHFYTREDGFVENLTLLPLLVCSVAGIRYWLILRKDKSPWFSITLWTIILFSIFVAGEEISWGQRIFGIESNDFFQQHNAQQETNLHNLVVGGKKVNRLVFSQLLTVAVAAYLLVLPWAYQRFDPVRTAIDRLGIPICRTYQVIASALLFASISMIPSGKNAEILEVGITFIFLLIFLYPANPHIFQKRRSTGPAVTLLENLRQTDEHNIPS